MAHGLSRQKRRKGFESRNLHIIQSKKAAFQLFNAVRKNLSPIIGDLVRMLTFDIQRVSVVHKPSGRIGWSPDPLRAMGTLGSKALFRRKILRAFLFV